MLSNILFNSVDLTGLTDTYFNRIKYSYPKPNRHNTSNTNYDANSD